MNRNEIWIHFMAAAVQSGHVDTSHYAETARACACLADYALGEYEKRIVGGTPDDQHFEPVYSLEIEPASREGSGT